MYITFSTDGIYWNTAYIACVHNTTVFLRFDSTNIRLTSITIYFFLNSKIGKFSKINFTLEPTLIHVPAKIVM